MRHLVPMLLCALAGPLNAQGTSGGTKEGDSVTVVIHHVRADKRALYDSLLQKVYAPAARRAGEKYPEFGKAFAARRRYVPTTMGPDSTFTYVYLYTEQVALPESPLGNAVLAAAGASKEQMAAYRDGLRSCLAPGSGSVRLIDQGYH
jgi:hypothetical protein